MPKEEYHKRKILTEKIAKELGMKRQDVVKVVARFLDLLKVDLINEGHANLKHFGTLRTVTLPARKYYCGKCKNEKYVDVPERKTVKFKPCKFFKDSLNS